ncbi:hypothetical protein GW17_00010227 [Ensete ventricosum]|nr:hypothetical protein GW17_00010227 [Ensete ventricosum]
MRPLPRVGHAAALPMPRDSRHVTCGGHPTDSVRRCRNSMAATTRVAAVACKGEGKKNLGHSFWQNDDFTAENL